MAKLNAVTPARADIEYFSGSTTMLSFYVTDDNDSPVDLSGKSLRWQAKNKKTSSAAAAELTSTITVDGDNNNRVNLPLDFDLEERSFVHELRNIDDDQPIMYGKLIVIGEVITD